MDCTINNYLFVGKFSKLLWCSTGSNFYLHLLGYDYSWFSNQLKILIEIQFGKFGIIMVQEIGQSTVVYELSYINLMLTIFKTVQEDEGSQCHHCGFCNLTPILWLQSDEVSVGTLRVMCWVAENKNTKWSAFRRTRLYEIALEFQFV